MGTIESATDGELVRAAREGDSRAFDRLVRRYRRPAYAVALSILKRHEDAEDAAQESLLVALERLEDCRDPSKFGGWLMTIVRNRSRNLIRRESLRDTDPVPPSARSTREGPELALARSETRARLRTALEALSPVQREVVLLHDLEGWKHREIAERMGMPAGTVRSHLHFARKKLREELTPPPSPVGSETE